VVVVCARPEEFARDTRPLIVLSESLFPWEAPLFALPVELPGEAQRLTHVGHRVVVVARRLLLGGPVIEACRSHGYS
jgi:hypothetical protein